MRTMHVSIALLLAATAAASAAAVDSFLTIDGVASDPASGALYLRVQGGDLDGDGAADVAAIRLTCSGAALDSASYAIISPRDAASGQASGKRTHKPMKIVKEWGAASPQLAAIKPTYDVKKVEGTGARSSADDAGWSPIQLSNAEGLCAEAATAGRVRSNIRNN